jgi:hypothetical protein
MLRLKLKGIISCLKHKIATEGNSGQKRAIVGGFQMFDDYYFLDDEEIEVDDEVETEDNYIDEYSAYELCAMLN